MITGNEHSLLLVLPSSYERIDEMSGPRSAHSTHAWAMGCEISVLLDLVARLAAQLGQAVGPGVVGG